MDDVELVSGTLRHGWPLGSNSTSRIGLIRSDANLHFSVVAAPLACKQASEEQVAEPEGASGTESQWPATGRLSKRLRAIIAQLRQESRIERLRATIAAGDSRAAAAQRYLSALHNGHAGPDRAREGKEAHR